MDIVSLPAEIDRKKLDSRYRLVIIAAQRAKAIALGGRRTIDSGSVKPTTVGVEEALSGDLEVLTGEDAIEARKEAKHEEARRRALAAEHREDVGTELSALEKDLKFYLNEKEEKERKAIEDLFSETDKEDGGPGKEG